MDYAMAQDDGHGVEEFEGRRCHHSRRFAHIENADLPLSRQSRHQGGQYSAYPRPATPFEITHSAKPLLVGSDQGARQPGRNPPNRLHLLAENRNTAYVDPEQVREEVQEARRFFAARLFVIDVTNRSIEETAAEIMMLLQAKNRRAKRRHDGERREPRGVIGWPVEHSLSPRLHGIGWKNMGLPAAIMRCRWSPGNCGQRLRHWHEKDFRRRQSHCPAQRNRRCAGGEVKLRLSASARSIPIITRADGTMHGRNTDVYGFTQNLLAAGFRRARTSCNASRRRRRGARGLAALLA